jgi:hypothetical protein
MMEGHSDIYYLNQQIFMEKILCEIKYVLNHVRTNERDKNEEAA